MPARVTITIPDEVWADVEAQKPRSLSTAAFLALLVDRGLTLGAEQREAPSKAVKSSSTRSSFKPNKESVPDRLSPYLPLILEFWQTKKGAKSETAWNFLIENLDRIRDKYGPQVVEEQLKLAINGKWQSIQLRNFESFSGKPGTKEPEHRHPASQVFTAKDFDNGPTTNPVLKDLF